MGYTRPRLRRLRKGGPIRNTVPDRHRTVWQWQAPGLQESQAFRVRPSGSGAIRVGPSRFPSLLALVSPRPRIFTFVAGSSGSLRRTSEVSAQVLDTAIDIGWASLLLES